VVEDEPGIALGLEDTLLLEGYEVEVVNNGLKASKRAMEEAFDLILLDVMLPGKNGFEVCRELRQSGLEAPIIFLTARTQESDRISGLDLGANDYVTKPFSPKELMARVRRLLRFVETSRQDRKRLEDQIDAAAEVQQQLFPRTQPFVPGLDYAGMCRPALGVSGDYYDFFTLPSGRLAILLADVCGKGMPAALVAASLQAAVRAYAPAADGNAGQLLKEVNQLLCETTSPERFVTLFYAVYDPARRELTWTNAGHCPALCLRADGELVRLESLTMPAGITRAMAPLQETMVMAPGDLLLINSDGIPEAANAQQEEFGEQRFENVVQENRNLGAAQLCGAILDCVREFSGGWHQGDDLTVVAAKLAAEGR